jgi:hypothetical protein
MLKQRRKEIIEYIKKNKSFLDRNTEALDIYEGNLLPYIDRILKESLSENYYRAIKDRVLPINILQRYVDKVSSTYSKCPKRTSDNPNHQAFVDYYADEMSIDNSGHVADAYTNIFKGFAWEPYIDNRGKPALRELPFNSFLVMSDSKVNPEEETVFIKLMGKMTDDDESMLVHVYTDTEFDAFYLNENEATEYLIDNQGMNPIGVIPFVYGKRQKNRLLPVLDSDMLKICKAIPVMLSDAAGAQMFQCFSILYGVDVNFDNAKMSPNVIWSLKSDKDSDKTPQVGTIKPEADTQKVVDFVTTIFTLWLETKGVRVGSIGSMDAGNTSSGIAKVIDELDIYEIMKKSQEWFEKDEAELWCVKMPKIHNYWIKSGMVNPADVPGLIPDGEELDIDIEFERPEPMKSRIELINEIKAEIELGTMTMEQAIRALHPEHDIDTMQETLNGRVIN